MSDPTKAPMHLIDKRALFACAEALGHGASKYAPDDWRKNNYAIGCKIPIAAAVRHLYQYLDGEHTDAESGLCHLAHAMASVMIALAVHERGRSDVPANWAHEMAVEATQVLVGSKFDYSDVRVPSWKDWEK